MGVGSKNLYSQEAKGFLKTKKTPLPATSRCQLPSHRAKLLGSPWAPPDHGKDSPRWVSEK